MPVHVAALVTDEDLVVLLLALVALDVPDAPAAAAAAAAVLLIRRPVPALSIPFGGMGVEFFLRRAGLLAIRRVPPAILGQSLPGLPVVRWLVLDLYPAEAVLEVILVLVPEIHSFGTLLRVLLHHRLEVRRLDIGFGVLPLGSGRHRPPPSGSSPLSPPGTTLTCRPIQGVRPLSIPLLHLDRDFARGSSRPLRFCRLLLVTLFLLLLVVQGSVFAPRVLKARVAQVEAIHPLDEPGASPIAGQVMAGATIALVPQHMPRTDAVTVAQVPGATIAVAVLSQAMTRAPCVTVIPVDVPWASVVVVARGRHVAGTILSFVTISDMSRATTRHLPLAPIAIIHMSGTTIPRGDMPRATIDIADMPGAKIDIIDMPGATIPIPASDMSRAAIPISLPAAVVVIGEPLSADDDIRHLSVI